MDRPGFFFCICPDAALLREYMERELIGPLTASEAGNHARPDIQTFWGDEELDRRFWDGLTLLGMDGRSRVLIVRGAQQLPADVWKKLEGLQQTYQLVYDEQAAYYQALLDERDAALARVMGHRGDAHD